MIWSTLIDILLGVPAFVFGLFPDFTAPAWADNVGGAFTEIGGALNAVGSWLNVPVGLTIFAFIIGAKLVKGTITTVLFIYDHIPGKAT